MSEGQGFTYEEWKEVYFKWNYVTDFVWQSIEYNKKRKYPEEFETQYPRPKENEYNYEERLKQWEADRDAYVEERYRWDTEKAFMKMMDLKEYFQKLGMPKF